MTQNSLRPGGKGCGHPSPFGGEDRVTDRIDAPLYDMKPPGMQPVLNDPPAHTGFEKLPPRQYPMLARGDLGDQPVHATI
jgi:hypothetical protein